MADWDATVGIDPSQYFKKTSQPRIREISYGDGYAQRISDGINNFKESWSLSFTNRTISDVNTMSAFLTARNGVESFTWTPPGEVVAYKVICRSWDTDTIVNDGTIGFGSLTATFERVYD